MTKPLPQVVVITDPLDAHVPFVQRHTDVPFIIIDPQRLLQGVDCTFMLKNNRMEVTYDGVRLDRVIGVWYRKPTALKSNQLSVADELKPYALTSMQKHFAQFLSAFRGSLWVNNYAALMRAESKALQLEVAAEVGLRVPATVMTSDAATAKQFIESQKACIVKAQSAFSPSYKDKSKAFLTSKIDAHKLPDLTNLHLAPAIFQQAIEPEFDVRVTVIGDEVFAAKILNETLDRSSKVLDWRVGHTEGDMRIEAFNDFPKAIARQCLALNKALGLVYGALDFVMDKQGKLWFLENNPNGQWGFVEEATGQPMGKAMARLLTSSSGRLQNAD